MRYRTVAMVALVAGAFLVALPVNEVSSASMATTYPRVSHAAGHPSYPLGHASRCRRGYGKQWRLRWVHGRKQRYLDCVWIRRTTTTTTTTTEPQSPPPPSASIEIVPLGTISYEVIGEIGTAVSESDGHVPAGTVTFWTGSDYQCTAALSPAPTLGTDISAGECEIYVITPGPTVTFTAIYQGDDGSSATTSLTVNISEAP